MLLTISGSLTGALLAAELEVSSFGWNGHFQPGRWTPLRVKYGDGTAGTATFDVTAQDAEGNLMTLRQAGVPANASGEFELRVKLGRLDGEVHIDLIDDLSQEVKASVLHRTQTGEDAEDAVKLNHLLLGILSRQEGFAEKVAAGLADVELPGRKRVQVVPMASADSLPRNPVSWDSLDVLLLAADVELPNAQANALQQWVREGGHLLLSMGAQADAYRESPIVEWLPLKVGKGLRLRDLSQFESFIGRSSRIEFSGRVDATELSGYLGEQLVGSLDGTLVASLPYGFGHVTVSGVDLDRPPLSTWNSLPRLLQQLSFPERRDADRESETGSKQLTDSGISELATQLNLAQQKFVGVSRSSTWVVMGAIVVYLLLIGPLDYVLVHRVLKRPELTWITFPLLMIGVAVVSVWAGRSTNVIETSVNQIDLIDIDSMQELVKVKSWMTGYSPESQRVAVEAEVNISDWSDAPTMHSQPAILSWDSVPEDGFGGLYRQSGFEALSSTDYHFSSASSKVEDLPVAQWSTASLTVDQFVQGLPLVESDLKGSTLGSVAGTVEHNLPGQLTEWMLVYGSRVYFPRPTRSSAAGYSIPPHQPVELTRSDLSVSRDLKGYLTGTRQIRIRTDDPIKKTRIVVEQEAYNLFSTDAKQILRILSFHEAAGGTRYTNLENSAMNRLDWTRLLNPQHAVLYGVLETSAGDEQSGSAVRWLWNGESVKRDQQTTIVRCLLPVEVQNDARRELPDLEELLKKNKR